MPGTTRAHQALGDLMNLLTGSLSGWRKLMSSNSVMVIAVMNQDDKPEITIVKPDEASIAVEMSTACVRAMMDIVTERINKRLRNPR